MNRFKTLLTVIGAVTILALAANTVSYAATGSALLLGKTNKATKQTTVKRTTAGPALGLTTKSASDAPLVTNGKGKVANLNADSLDGKDSTAFAPMPTVIRGSWAMGTTAAAGGATTGEGISFGWTLPAAPIAHFIPVGEPLPAGCSGSAAFPSAAPGHLCVFALFSTGNFTVAAVCDSGNFTCPGASRFGAAVFGVSTGAGNFQMSGNWAVGATSVTASP